MTLREAFKNLSAGSPGRPSSALADFPGFEGLSVRKVSPRELDDLAADDQAGNDRARSACLFAANPDGSRLFELSDALWLGTKDALPLVERINHYGRRYNGLTEESRKGPGASESLCKKLRRRGGRWFALLLDAASPASAADTDTTPSGCEPNARGVYRTWRTAWDLDPWGEHRGDVQAAVIASLVDAGRLQKRPGPLREYMPYYHEEPSPRKTPGQLKQIFQGIAAVFQNWKKKTERLRTETVP